MVDERRGTAVDKIGNRAVDLPRVGCEVRALVALLVSEGCTETAHRTHRGRDPLNAPHQGEGRMAYTAPGALTLRNNPVTLAGPEIKAGATAPDFAALDNGLQPVKLSGAHGKVIVLSSVPSLDTPVCDTETRRFNEEAGKLGGNVEVWTISMDLPFAQKRWCGAAGVTNV